MDNADSNINTNDVPSEKSALDQLNSYCLSLLQQDYSGIASEYTTLSQYLYAHLMAENRQISDDFLKAAIDEMDHLRLIGHSIKRLGGDPMFVGEFVNFWDSTIVPYGSSTLNRLELAIKNEYSAIRRYYELLTLIDDKFIKKVLEQIIADEKRHARIFERDLNKYFK